MPILVLDANDDGINNSVYTSVTNATIEGLFLSFLFSCYFLGTL